MKTISSTSSCSPLTTAMPILQAIDLTVNHVHVHFHPRAVHSDWVQNAALAIHHENAAGWRGMTVLSAGRLIALAFFITS